MTAFLPLDAAAPFPPTPAFLVPSPDPAGHVKRVVKAVLKARRIAVVCGAGISVQAGIPDFRSSEGLFQSLKKDHPTLSSGKDLFDASVFSSEDTTSLFCQMIAQLSQLSEAAEPTAFHRFLRVLDDRRRLLRVYTQNIDALEEKSGLTFGVPELDVKRTKPRSKGKVPAPDAPQVEAPSIDAVQPDEPSTSRLPSPPAETPKCIPLHGTLQSVHCVTCTHSYPLRDYIDSLVSGTPPPCPQCTALEETRQLIGKRSRGVGKLRPSVVLYNEDHKDGEEVGNVVRKDLMGSSKGKGRAGADLLLVVGTSLRVPGTKRIVREFSKAVRSRHAAMNAPPDEPTVSAHGLVTPTSSPRPSPAEDEEPPVRTIYLNLDFPVPTREWEGVFDVWIRGDAQAFARMVHEELEKEEQAKEAARERKRRREEAAAENAKLVEGREREEEGRVQPDITSPQKKGKKRKEQAHSENDADGEAQPRQTKKRKTGNPPMSPVSPPLKTEQKREKGKKPTSSNVRKPETAFPTPPSSKDDPSKRRLTIRVPPLAAPLAARPEVVITTRLKVKSSVHECGPFSSPLSSSPVSTCDTPSKLSKTSSLTTSRYSTPLPSHHADPGSLYDMSPLSSSLSQVEAPPPASSAKSPPLSTPGRPDETVSGLTGCFSSSPLSSIPPTPPPSPSQELSPPPSPLPSPHKKRKVSKAPPSPAGLFLGHRPGIKANYRLDRWHREDNDAHSPTSENRYPESFERSTRGLSA